MRKLVILIIPLLFIGCGDDSDPNPGNGSTQNPANGENPAGPSEPKQTLVQAKSDFKTDIVRAGEEVGAPQEPPADTFQLIRYKSPAGDLAAYVTNDPGDGMKHPAVIWITGGDNNSIGDVWSPAERSNDQTVSAFREAGIVMMFPSQRGGNDNPGLREGFLGEVDDVLAAADHLAALPYVDPEQIYLGGHSTGGTLAMLVGQTSNRFRAVFSLGPVATPLHYGGEFVYCNPYSIAEMKVRAPIHWLHCVESPMYVIEGDAGNWPSIDEMVRVNKNPKVQFLKARGHNHFSVIAPVVEMLAKQINAGKVELNEDMFAELK